MKVLSARVDALELAYRVKLDPAFRAYLEERAKIAREHGRAAVEWGVAMPAHPANQKMRRLGSVRAVWTEEEHVKATERRTLVWGELRYSRSEKVWQITNEPYFRLRVDLCAPGGDVGPRAREPRDPLAANVEKELDEQAVGSEPGFTVVIVWYAQELARRGIEAAIRESAAIAALCGDVREQRLRRFDLCADVEGFAIEERMLDRLVKRPQAGWALDYDDGSRETKREADAKAHTTSHGKKSGPKHAARAGRRRLTGVSVGRGGALMLRVYDKREELARADDRCVERREAEEDRWIAAGVGPVALDALDVARVEFQIRGEALRELGLRDPDCILEAERDKDGKKIGQRIAIVKDEATGKMRQATISDWLDSVWATCLEWCRLVVPRRSKHGKPIAPSRCKDDPRWAILRTVRFTRTWGAILGRYRPRAAASAAQALGVTLSQAGREGQLTREWSEDAGGYEKHYDPIGLLRHRLDILKRDERERILEWLIERFGGPVGANVHLAARANAARARFMRPGQTAPPKRARIVGTDPMAASGVWTMPLSVAG